MDRYFQWPPYPTAILVVDDNQDSAISLALMLKIMGHETRTAFDGMEAVSKTMGLDAVAPGAQQGPKAQTLAHPHRRQALEP